jgi:predicted ATPase/DNA-binding winged helix-turn-helix (wHTH) protein
MTKTPASSGRAYAFGAFQLLPAQRTLLHEGSPVRLGSRAMDILCLLVERAGEVVSKEALIAHVWPHTVVDEAGLRVHIAALRKVLGESRSGLRHIANVPLRGYSFVVPVSPVALAGAGPVLAREARAADAAATLPPRLGRLIGRDEAVEAVIETLPRRRFVTLVGPGGMGKTSVALAAAERLQAQFAQGARFVDLATLSEPALVPSAVAAVLGVAMPSGDPTREVAAWVAGRELLVVLDNCEHVVDAAAALAELLLGRAPGLSILATSREPLRARGEWVQRLTSLAAPPANASTRYAQALAYPAFELFVERATASADSLSFGDADVPQIAHLCRALDGMPLAIELVAARTAVFGLPGLVARLDDHLSLPTVGHRTALPRHQGLRATLDWSHGLLSVPEQCLLRRLAAFRERFTLEAALAVATDAGLDAAALTQALMNLVAKSLLSAEPGDGTVQYRLLETTRSYAAERLLASGEGPSTARRHAEHCRALVERAARDAETLVPALWRERHARKVDELRAALAWAFGEGGDAALGAELVAASAPLWFGLWMVNEYLQRIEAAIARLPAAQAGSALDMQLHLMQGQALLALRGGAPEALAALSRSITLARERRDADCQLRGLWSSFSLQALRGDYPAALAAAEDYGAVAREAGDEMAGYVWHRIMALCLHLLGHQPQALQHVQQALHPATIGMPSQGTLFHLDHRSAGLTQLARIQWLLGRPDEARHAAEQAVQAAEVADHAISLAYTLSYAACPVALWCGDDALAQRHVAALQHCTQEHSLAFWQSWPPLFQHAIDLRRGLAPPALDESALHFSHVDMLATLHPSLAGPTALARAEAGLNAW